MSRRVVYFKSWWTNIGNAFIDLGCVYLLDRIAKEKGFDFYVVSSSLLELVYLQRMFRRKSGFVKRVPLSFRRRIPAFLRRRIKKVFVGDQYSCVDVSLTTFNLLEHLDADYFIFSGMMLDPFIIKINERSFRAASKRGKVVFLSVGGESYSPEEENYVKKFLRELKPYVLVTRDKTTFDNYRNISYYCYDGIDAGFYVRWAFRPPRLNIDDYIVLCFDKLAPPRVPSGYNVIRTHHALRIDLYPELFEKYLSEDNVFISDNPYDYLIVYSNAREVHSDRVHACVAAMAYGVPCRLYYETKRAELFRRLNVDPLKTLSKVDEGVLESEMRKQYEFLLEVLV